MSLSLGHPGRVEFPMDFFDSQNEFHLLSFKLPKMKLPSGKKGHNLYCKTLAHQVFFLNGNLSTNYPCLLCVDFQSLLWIAATTDWECLSDVVSHVHPWQTSKI